ncbi:MAG TPA: alpha/beta hydrolase [Nocardioides sp.]|uniref:alpha/beta fold hydrolase n=1 Tax=Nocardioides sp. TaxID=35761 RepID=UPI002F42E15A
MSTITLPDGRALEVEVNGPDTGPVVVFHHGTPGASEPLPAHVQAAAARGHRLVTTCRPGYGASTRAPGRSVADVAADTGAVLDHLGVDTCLTMGWSGGGPHALACAALLPDRVRGVTVIAGVAPYDAEGVDWLAGMGPENLEEFGLALEGEAKLRPYLEEQQPALASITPEEVAEALGGLVPPVDVAAITGDLAECLAAEFRHGVSSGVDGWLDDDLAFVRPWGFDLAELRVPTYLWQGDQDLMVPFAHGVWLAEHLPGVVSHLEAGEGHISIGAGAAARILDELVAS